MELEYIGGGYTDPIKEACIDVREESIYIAVDWRLFFDGDESVPEEVFKLWEEDMPCHVEDLHLPTNILEYYELPRFEKVLSQGGIDNIVRWLNETGHTGVAYCLGAINYHIPTIEEYEENVSEDI